MIFIITRVFNKEYYIHSLSAEYSLPVATVPFLFANNLSLSTVCVTCNLRPFPVPVSRTRLLAPVLRTRLLAPVSRTCLLAPVSRTRTRTRSPYPFTVAPVPRTHLLAPVYSHPFTRTCSPYPYLFSGIHLNLPVPVACMPSFLATICLLLFRSLASRNFCCRFQSAFIIWVFLYFERLISLPTVLEVII